MKFKLNGKSITIPHSWDEVTYKQFLAIGKIKNDLPELLSVLTGVDKDTLLKANIKGLDQVLAAIAFIQDQPDWSDAVSNVGPYKLPPTASGKFEIQFESLIQFEDMRSHWASLKEITADTLLDTAGIFSAIYLQKIRDGEYSYDKALIMAKEEIPNYLAREVVSVGTFFLVKLKNLLNGTKANSPHTNQSQGKSTGKATKKPSARTARSTKSRGR